MFTLLIFILIFSILIIAHESGHFFLARVMGVRVEQFSLGFGPRLFRKKKKGTEYSVSAIPFGGYVKLAGDNPEEYKGKPDEYLSQAPGRRFWIIFAGPLLNYILGFLCFWMIFFLGYPTLTTKVGGLLDGFGAKETGIQAGDRIIAVGGKKVEYWEELQEAVRAQKGAENVSVLISRKDKEIKLEVPLKQKQVDNLLGEKQKVGLLGITPFDEVVKVRHGFVQSFGLGLSKTIEITSMTYKGLWRMITGKLSIRESVTGPLGMFYITSKVASVGFIAVLHFIAILTISLAIFNILPFPVLDGGHIMFIGLEKLRGKSVSAKTEQVLTQAGMTLIIAFALFVTYNDLVRFFGDKIQKFFVK